MRNRAEIVGASQGTMANQPLQGCCIRILDNIGDDPRQVPHRLCGICRTALVVPAEEGREGRPKISREPDVRCALWKVQATTPTLPAAGDRLQSVRWVRAHYVQMQQARS